MKSRALYRPRGSVQSEINDHITDEFEWIADHGTYIEYMLTK